MSEKNWYVVHTLSGFEQRARKSLLERAKTEGLEEDIEDVLIPVENVVEIVRGERKTSKRKFLPGYIVVKMDLNERTWHLVKSTPKVTGFIGNTRRPRPLPEAEVRNLLGHMAPADESSRPKVEFAVGGTVRVHDGPFSGFDGVVEEVNADKGKVKVLLSMFGRETPVELDFIQVEKTS